MYETFGMTEDLLALQGLSLMEILFQKDLY